MGRVDGKVAFITGAGQGQGHAHALRLVEEGADIVATDLCGELPVNYRPATRRISRRTQELVERTGRRCLALTADVRRPEQLEAAVAEGLSVFGHLNVVVANAGVITFHHRSLDIPPAIFDLIVQTNLVGVWNTVRATAPPMIEAGRGGSMVFVSSSAGLRGQAHYAHYVASKFGVQGLMQSLANELGPHRIRVNTVNPTGVVSPGIGRDPTIAELHATEPLFVQGGRNVLPDLDCPAEEGAAPVGALQAVEVANAVLWLASDEARYVTGVALPVDAGNTVKP